MNVPCPAGGRKYHSSGSGSASSSGVVRIHGRHERQPPRSRAVEPAPRRPSVERPAPQSRAVSAMAGPMTFRMSTFNRLARRWRSRRARTTAGGTETRSRKICQPRCSDAMRGEVPVVCAASICAAADSADGNAGEEEEERRRHPAEHHEPPEPSAARARPRSVQASNVCASIMTSTATPRSQSRYASRWTRRRCVTRLIEVVHSSGMSCRSECQTEQSFSRESAIARSSCAGSPSPRTAK